MFSKFLEDSFSTLKFCQENHKKLDEIGTPISEYLMKLNNLMAKFGNSDELKASNAQFSFKASKFADLFKSADIDACKIISKTIVEKTNVCN